MLLGCLHKSTITALIKCVINCRILKQEYQLQSKTAVIPTLAYGSNVL